MSLLHKGGGPNSPKMQEAMKDPEVKSFVEKVMKKLGPIMGMMGGEGGGVSPGFGGTAAPSGRNPPKPTFDEEVD